MSTKTSSTCSNNNSLAEDLEKTPPREDFVEEIVRTPPRSVTGKPSSDPVTTPTKILEVESQIKLVDMSDGNVDEEFVETQEIPEIPVAGEESDKKKKKNGKESINDKEREKGEEREKDEEEIKKGKICEEVTDIQQNEMKEIQDEEEGMGNQSDDSDKTAVETDDPDTGAAKSDQENEADNEDEISPTTESESKQEEPAVVIEDEDAETDCEMEDQSKTDNVEQLNPDDVDDDELQITSVQDPCSLVITHVQESPSVDEIGDPAGEVAESDDTSPPDTEDRPAVDDKEEGNNPPPPDAEV